MRAPFEPPIHPERGDHAIFLPFDVLARRLADKWVYRQVQMEISRMLARGELIAERDPATGEYWYRAAPEHVAA